MSDSISVSDSCSESAKEFEDFVLKTHSTIRLRQVRKIGNGNKTSVKKMNFDDHCQIPDLVHIGNNIVFDEKGRVMISSAQNILLKSVF